MKDPIWRPEMLGNTAMDAAHWAVYGALSGLACTPGKAFRAAYMAFVAALERDFRLEEEAMELIGYQGLAVHREQHARALAGLHHAQAALDEGDPQPARHSVGLLAHWLPLHILTMDQALAAAWSVAQRRPRNDA